MSQGSVTLDPAISVSRSSEVEQATEGGALELQQAVPERPGAPGAKAPGGAAPEPVQASGCTVHSSGGRDGPPESVH